MRLIIDVREHALYEKCESILSNDPNYSRIESESLPIGDILVKTDEGKDVMIVERKSLSDLLSSIKDGRYEEQSHRLKHASGFPSHNIVYIIEGVLSTLRTPMEKKIVFSSIASLYYFKGFSVMRTSCVQETAELLIHMCDKIDRNFMKGVMPSYMVDNNYSAAAVTALYSSPPPEEKSYSGFVKTVKKDNIQPENIGEIMLIQIPGISSIYAKAILEKFGGFSNLVSQVKSGSAVFDISYDCKGKQRRIPKTCGEQIKKFVEGL